MSYARTLCQTITVLCCLAMTVTTHAGDKNKTSTVKCPQSSLNAELGKLDRSISNTLEIEGNCIEDVVIEGFRDLTLIGLDGASITATNIDLSDQGASTVALSILDSRVSVETVIINAGRYGAECTRRSMCRFYDVTVQGGWNGFSAQEQSGLDIFGPSTITGGLAWGIGVFGGSSVNLRPNEFGGSQSDPGPTISGYDTGVWAQDGSFFRTDNVTITGNGDGVFAQRDAVVKMFTYDPAIAGVSNNSNNGVTIRRNSTAQLGLPITNNGGSGLRVGQLSFVQFFGTSSGNAGGDFICEHSTAISAPWHICGN